MKEKDNKIDNLARIVAEGFLEMGNRFDGLENKLRKEISDVRTELKQEISSVRSELKTDIHELRGDVLEIKTDVKILKKRTLEDDDALASENIKREREIEIIKKEIKGLRLARS